MKTGIVYHEKYLQYNLGLGHPESPERLKKIMEVLKKIMDKLESLRPSQASEEDLLRVHTKGYIEKIKKMSQVGGALTLDTPVPSEVYEIAKLSAGGAILAGKSVCEKKVDNAFALIRPPGHHAGKDFGGGFCFFNNIAIMIEYLRAKHGLKKFAILDWDVHHGNGTQEIFYTDPSVLYFSTHQSPLYPGTGMIDDIGEGKGKGYNVNVPLNPGTSGASFLYILKELFIPLTQEFKPDIICVSAGYDAYFNDPLASLNFTIKTYADATKLVKNIVEKVCDGRVVIALEGGYNLEALSHGVLATISILSGLNEVKEPYQSSEQKVGEDVKQRVSDINKKLSDYWSF
jgi:acetoin utilization deacetylase AcuC-like enzyme